MDVMLIGEKTLKIKGKKTVFVIDPVSSIGKTEADAVINLSKLSDFSINKLDGVRVTFSGPGEYEVGGIKTTLQKAGDGCVATFDVDGMSVLVGSGAALEKIMDKVESANMVIANAASEFNYSVLTAFEPKVLIVFGDKKEEVKKTLGKEAEVMSKYSSAKDKLSDEMQFVLLG